MARQPDRPPPPPTVQRVRVRYAKRGRLRFTSHRDIQRALERALRRAGVPMAYSAGFTPHPKVSWAGAAPTGVASEAEYVELGLAEAVDPDALRVALDAALPPGLDVLEVVPATVGALADRLVASHWEIRLPGVAPEVAAEAARVFLATTTFPVTRVLTTGTRELDARAATVALDVVAEERPERAGDAPAPPDSGESVAPCAILRLVVRHVTPAVRPDDVLTALRQAADLVPPSPPAVTRRAQGPLGVDGRIADPLEPDRQAARSAAAR